MSEEMFNIGNQGASAGQENSGAQVKHPYPRSYGTDDNFTDTGDNFSDKTANNFDKNTKEQGKNNEKMPRREENKMQSNASKNIQAKDMQDRGTLLTAPLGGIQSVDEYAFAFSPETQVDHVLINDFKNFALQKQMTVDTAQQVASFYESFVQKANADHALNTRVAENELRETCENDVEFGGGKFHENLRYAKAAMARFDDGALGKILTESGFGSHPEVVRFMYRVGKALSEKDMVMGDVPQRELSAAELFYPSMRKG